MSSLEKVSPGIRPLFFSQKIAANEPEKKMPSTAAKATTLSPVEHDTFSVRHERACCSSAGTSASPALEGRDVRCSTRCCARPHPPADPEARRSALATALNHRQAQKNRKNWAHSETATKKSQKGKNKSGQSGQDLSIAFSLSAKRQGNGRVTNIQNWERPVSFKINKQKNPSPSHKQLVSHLSTKEITALLVPVLPVLYRN